MMNKPEKPQGECPICKGTGRTPAQPHMQKYASAIAGYDLRDNTIPCTNCGGQYMSLRATGRVPLDKHGQPCTHSYDHTLLGNCYHGYRCKHCDDYYTIDSGD